MIKILVNREERNSEVESEFYSKVIKLSSRVIYSSLHSEGNFVNVNNQNS